MEHAILHLLYARFMHKFLLKIGEFDKPFEPFKQLITQGLVKGLTYKLKKNGKYLKINELDKYSKEEIEILNEKMSKSKGNGINPLEVIEKHGSDCLRLALFFYGPTKNDIVWDDNFQKTLVFLIFNINNKIFLSQITSIKSGLIL